METLQILNARPEMAGEIYQLGQYDLDTTGECPTLDGLREHIARFPAGQFVAIINNQVVGYAITMRTRRSPQEKPLPWFTAIGGHCLSNHQSDGEWLYGVDFLIDPDFRKRGIGTKMYTARFNLVRRLNLRGFYAGGMLAGYHRYHTHMTIRDYADRVMRGDLSDPTVTMQMNRGFKAAGLIENYCRSYEYPHNNAMLIVWPNPQHQASVYQPQPVRLAQTALMPG